MASFIESLESRMFLSVAPSVGALKAESSVVLADLKALDKTGQANFKLIAADLKSAGELKSSAVSLATLKIEGKAGFAETSASVKVVGRLIESDVTKLLADAALVRKHPTNTIDTGKLTAISTKLQTDASTGLTVIDAAIAAEHDKNSTNLTAIEDANPTNTKLASDVSTTIGPNTAAARTALENSTSTALTTDVDAIVAAFPA